MVHFGIKSVAQVVAERRNVVQEKCTGSADKGASSRRFVQKIGEIIFFVGGGTQVPHTNKNDASLSQIMRLRTSITYCVYTIPGMKKIRASLWK